MTVRFFAFLLAAVCWSGSALHAQATAALAARDAVDHRLAGKTAGESTYRLWYNNADFTNGTLFQWNQQLWCADWIPHLTCFSPWNSHQKNYQAGTLVTPRHVLFAQHFSGVGGSGALQPGDALCFVGLHGTLHRATLQHTPQQVGSSDLCLGTLDHDLPPDVLPVQVLPAGLPANFFPPGTPVVFTNKAKEARLAEVVSFGGSVIRSAIDPARGPWTVSPAPAVVGDSGSPVFLILHDRPVLWWLFSTPGSGDPVSAHLAEINDLLPSRYHLDVAALKP